MAKIINQNGNCYFFEDFIPRDHQQIYQTLINEIHWQQDEITLYGKKHLTPRFHAWYADRGAQYTYSKIKLPRHEWHPLLLELKTKIEKKVGLTFNGVLLNYYRDGNDSNGWHSDDEKELVQPIHIASLSFGADRDFHFRRKGQTKKEASVVLSSGSLLFMEAPFQEHWQHALPKRKSLSEGRVNLTFRLVRELESKEIP